MRFDYGSPVASWCISFLLLSDEREYSLGRSGEKVWSGRASGGRFRSPNFPPNYATVLDNLAYVNVIEKIEAIMSS
jgi:hypothetical protein